MTISQDVAFSQLLSFGPVSRLLKRRSEGVVIPGRKLWATARDLRKLRFKTPDLGSRMIRSFLARM